MEPTSIVEDTERTRFCPQMDRRTDRQTDKVKPVYPLSTSLKRGGMIIQQISLWLLPNVWLLEYGSGAENCNLAKICFIVTGIMIQMIKSGPKFPDVTIAELSLHVQNSDMNGFNYEHINPFWNVSLIQINPALIN